mgnify:CR=1 FL=1
MSEDCIVQLETSCILNVPLKLYQKDFSFIVNGQKYQTSFLISDLISEKISNIHNIDPTFNEYSINTENNGDFSTILKLISFQETAISKSELPFIAEIIKDLEIKSIKIMNSNKHPEFNEDNIFQELHQYETNKYFYSEYYDESIEYISTHFSELLQSKENEIANIEINSLFNILNHPKLRLKNEDEILTFINKLYLKESKYSILYETVLFSNVTKSTICEFINIFDINDINNQIWHNLSTRFRCEIIQEKEEITGKIERYGYNNNNKKNRGQLFTSNNDDKFDGIINYLKNESNYNIGITSSTTHSSLIPSNVIEYEDRNKWFHSKDQPNNWICFDFNEKRIIPSNYKIRSSIYDVNQHNPRSWNIEGSNDNANWEILSEEKDSQYLNGKHLVHLFTINNKITKEYRYIRMRLTGKNWMDYDYFMLDSFELYGNLI